MKQDQDSLLLTAAADGELDVGRSMDLQLRLAREPALKAAWDRQLALRTIIRKGADYHELPAGLKERLAASIATAPSETPPRVSMSLTAAVASAGRRRWLMTAGTALVASILSAGVTWVGLNGYKRAVAGPERMIDEAVTAHIRAAMVDRLVEVPSSDQHTVRPWMSAHLTYSPPVPDLSVQGFELVGGRRDVIDGQPAAVLVYRRRQHVISTFVWPSVAATEASSRTVRGFNALETRHGAMTYLIVSDLNQRELTEFAELIQSER